jgi:hypothetical protein
MALGSARITLRVGICVAALLLAPLQPGQTFGPHPGRAVAQTPATAEKEAFEAAKELGTVEAWDAFLSNFPSGFHADLARAYVKKLAEQPQAAAPPPQAAPAPNDFPVAAGSWGGIVRDGPGQSYRKVDSLDEGDPVTLMARTDVFENGFPWFKIAYGDGGSGYQWGGILCAIGDERSDVFKTCPAATGKSTKRAASNPAPSGDGGRCKRLKALCSKTDRDDDCKLYLTTCTGHGDN